MFLNKSLPGYYLKGNKEPYYINIYTHSKQVNSQKWQESHQGKKAKKAVDGGTSGQDWAQQAQLQSGTELTYVRERGWSGKKLSQGLFSSTLYPGTDLDSTERLEPSFLGVATLSFDFCLPWKGSSWLSGGLSPSETLPEELSWSKRGKNRGSLELRQS